MRRVKPSEGQTFSFDFIRVTPLVSPSIGAVENSVWHILMAPGNPGQAHSVDHEHVFVAVAGAALSHVGEESIIIEAGDAVLVQANEMFCIENPNDTPFEAICIMPVGAVADIPGQEPLVFPWAQ